MNALRSVFGTVLATVGAGVLIGAVAIGAFGMSIYLIERALPSGEATTTSPTHVSVAPNFLGEPAIVLVCWRAYDPDATYDLLVRHWDFGEEWTELRENVDLVPCGNDFGATHTFSAENLYHLMLRACVDRRCSEWTPVTSGDQHWLQIPCYSASGEGCYYGNEGSDAQAVR